MAMRFEGKSIIVTGAGAGMGRATSLAFAREGGRVLVADIKESAARETASLIKHAGGTAQAYCLDVRSEASVKGMVEHAVQAFGRLDVAFNNAGVHRINTPLADVDETSWDAVMDVNLKGVFFCMKYEIPAMIANGGGAIVNTSSIGGVTAAPGLGPYIASKHGVVGLTRAAALDYISQGVRINAVLPGATHTAMLDDWLVHEGAGDAIKKQHPIGRWAEASEIASAVLFLASSEASFIVGHPLLVDGGVTAT